MTEQHYKRLQSRKQARKTKHRVDVMSKKNVQIHWSPRVRLYYVLHVIVRLAMEIVFFYTTYLLQTYQTKVVRFFKLDMTLDFLRKQECSKFGLYPILTTVRMAWWQTPPTHARRYLSSFKTLIWSLYVIRTGKYRAGCLDQLKNHCLCCICWQRSYFAAS